MKELSIYELQEINGGFKMGLGLLFSAGVSFIIGLIDGFIRPLPCK